MSSTHARCERLPPELRAKVLSFHPLAAAIPPSVSRSAKELFDDFIDAQTPRLRTLPFRVAGAASSANVALLVEPRAHPALEHVVRNAMLMLNGVGRDDAPPTWQLQIFHGTDNLQYLRTVLTADELEHVQLISLGVDNLSNLSHNELMCTHWLWSRVAAERVLVFQTDSLICRPGVDDFQSWDYIGAPWRHDDLWCVGKPWLTSVGGNGGFSLRSRQRTLECLDAHGYLRGQCEDVFYVEAMPKVGGVVADRASASRFSVESVWAPRPFGFHAAYKWLPSEQMEELLSATSRAYDDLEQQRDGPGRSAQ